MATPVHTASAPLFTPTEVARYEYIAVARRSLIECGIHPYDAQIFAKDLHKLLGRSCPVADAHEFYAGLTEILPDEQKVQP